MFRLHAPIAAVFELSICAGLVPAIFLSTIGMTQRLTPEALSERRKQRLRSYWALPLIVLLAGVGLSQMPIPMNPGVAVAPPAGDVRYVLWNVRHMDILGQIIILMGGALGVVILIKESRHD
jgi:NADH-quinone oxidoreductase subunit J